MYAPQSIPLLNLDSQNHGYMVFGNTGMDDKDLFMRAANGEDIISQIYPSLTLQNLKSGGSPLITKAQAAKLPSFDNAIATKTATGTWYKNPNGDMLYVDKKGYKQWVMANRE